MMENIFYFRRINAIGGTEQFLYEIAKKYCGLDITIYYDSADPLQLKRMKQLVRCRKRFPGETVKCRKAFFNYNIDMIDDVEADEYIFICHAIYQELGMKPPIDHPKLTKAIGVSEYSSRMLREYAQAIGKELEVVTCYNPLMMEEPKKVIRLISATRLDDKVKGGQRTLKLIRALDDYSLMNDRQYLWTIFTNKTQLKISSPNVCLMKGRQDIRSYIADSDYLVQLSNDMETYCYSVNEALSYGVPVVTTPLSIMKELPVSDEMHIECDWDMLNAEDVAKQIFERDRRKFSYTPPEDRWDTILFDIPSNYRYDEELIKVQATSNWKTGKITDKDRLVIPEPGSCWEIDQDRYEELRMFEQRNNIKLIETV